MTETKYTNAPWRLEHDKGHIAGQIYGKGCIAPNIFIADILIEDEESAANANLIAAAPELLEALEEANEQLKNSHEYMRSMRNVMLQTDLSELPEGITFIDLDSQDDVMLAGKAAEEAISKAKGSS